MMILTPHEKRQHPLSLNDGRCWRWDRYKSRAYVRAVFETFSFVVDNFFDIAFKPF
jgi:hypothetical protein